MPNMVLQVEFLDGTLKLYDVKPLIKRLKKLSLFNLVYVDTGGYGIAWNKDIDLACNELWENGI